ncbi:NH(3)-dependent NAD(+) synthetase [Thalassoporum mexicanum PCC 7367]|uniref:NAD+ synthase n=1 Tax=Thalassoporum mexicanum TaxID=3457544 RepID=UPI00029FC2DC|nr:NAD+ synthase [Pseudanabaena sp. PCC 7367]AFY70684.1 NH(3)-dependent NAD(+) synthetase [Pseudanabaena sp. PCC 7367]
MNDSFSIAVAQLNPIVGDLAGNATKILVAAQQCSDRSVRLMLTPELSLCGYPPRDLLVYDRFIQDMAIALAHLAQELPTDLAVLVGTVTVNEQAAQIGTKPLFNSAALLAGGKVQRIFHKRLLPTYDVFDEDRYFAQGTESNFFVLPVLPVLPRSPQDQIATTNMNDFNYAEDLDPAQDHDNGDLIRIGVTICEDFWNDERFWGKRNYAANPVADLVNCNLDLLVNLSASPFAVNKQKLREAMIQHSAKQYDLPIVYVNQVGGNDDLLFDGNSVAFSREGYLIGRANAFSEDLLILDFDAKERKLVSSTLVDLPETEEAEIWQALVLGLGDYARKCGFRKVVLGLSGGIDSALVAAIAVAAVGADNVLGILMPSPYSSEHSISDALKLSHSLGIETQTIAIGDLMASFDRSLSKLFIGTESDVTEENLQSRIRGNLLMAISNKFGHLLLSTGNKSELAVGYCTLYGDMNGGFAAIADVPKTKVFSLCRWLNQTQQYGNKPPIPTLGKSEIIPAHIISKPPSAELKPDQVDQDSLPPYEVLDDILARWIDQKADVSQIIAATGYDSAIVEQVIQLATRAEFKRRQAAPGLKITDRAFGSGWRMPIASRRSLYS